MVLGLCVAWIAARNPWKGTFHRVARGHSGVGEKGRKVGRGKTGWGREDWGRFRPRMDISRSCHEILLLLPHLKALYGLLESAPAIELLAGERLDGHEGPFQL